MNFLNSTTLFTSRLFYITTFLRIVTLFNSQKSNLFSSFPIFKLFPIILRFSYITNFLNITIFFFIVIILQLISYYHKYILVILQFILIVLRLYCIITSFLCNNAINDCRILQLYSWIIRNLINKWSLIKSKQSQSALQKMMSKLNWCFDASTEYGVGVAQRLTFCLAQLACQLTVPPLRLESSRETARKILLGQEKLRSETKVKLCFDSPPQLLMLRPVNLGHQFVRHLCFWTWEELIRMEYVTTHTEVGDLGSDGMQGDAGARGQHWQTFSPFLPQGALNLKEIWRENLPKHEFNTIWSSFCTRVCVCLLKQTNSREYKPNRTAGSSGSSQEQQTQYKSSFHRFKYMSRRQMLCCC